MTFNLRYILNGTQTEKSFATELQRVLFVILILPRAEIVKEWES